jgi:hypothetical protein
MAGQVLLIADRPEAVIQTGQPPAQMAAYLLDIPDGEGALQVAADFAASQGFPVGTAARVIDLTADPLSMVVFTLTSSWTQTDIVPPGFVAPT